MTQLLPTVEQVKKTLSDYTHRFSPKIGKILAIIEMVRISLSVNRIIVSNRSDRHRQDIVIYRIVITNSWCTFTQRPSMPKVPCVYCTRRNEFHVISDRQTCPYIPCNRNGQPQPPLASASAATPRGNMRQVPRTKYLRSFCSPAALRWFVGPVLLLGR